MWRWMREKSYWAEAQACHKVVFWTPYQPIKNFKSNPPAACRFVHSWWYAVEQITFLRQRHQKFVDHRKRVNQLICRKSTFRLICNPLRNNYFRLVLCRTRACQCAHYQSVFTLRNAHSWEKTFASDIVRTIWGQAVPFLAVTKNGSTCSFEMHRCMCHPNKVKWKTHQYIYKSTFCWSWCVTVWVNAISV